MRSTWKLLLGFTLLFSQLGLGTHITYAKMMGGKVMIIGCWSIEKIDETQLKFENQDGMKFIVDPKKAHDSELVSCDGQGHVSLNNIPLMLGDKLLKKFGLNEHDEMTALKRCLERMDCDEATIAASILFDDPFKRWLMQITTTEGNPPQIKDGILKIPKGDHGLRQLSISKQSGGVLILSKGICQELPEKIGDIELSPPTSRITVDYSRDCRYEDGAIMKLGKQSDRYDYELLGEKISPEAATYKIIGGKPVRIDEKANE